MTFDGPVEYYMHEVPMRGHNRPPKDMLTAEERLAKIFRIALSGKGSAVEALVEITAIAGMSAQNLFSATIEEWCRITRTKNKKNARTYRDSLFKNGWAEVEGEGRRKTFKAGYTEDQITAAVEAMRERVLPSTCGEVLTSTPTGTDEYPSEVLTSTPQEVRTSTPPSCARVSYTGNIKNIPLPRACESWRSFVLVDGNLAITDAGMKFWMGRGMDEARIDLALLEADGKLSDYDRKTPDGVEKKAGLFFSRNLQEKIDRDKRYEAACARKEGANQKRRPAGSKEALELLRKQKERGER